MNTASNRELLPDNGGEAQLSLFPPKQISPVHRTIHYLGSKTRLLSPIQEAVAEVAPPGRTVCDLFAGSGMVSIGLASAWNLVAVDIQEYSRVLCNGLLNPPDHRSEIGTSIVEAAKTGKLRRTLRKSLADLIEYENACMEDAAKGNAEALCNVLEHKPLVAQASGKHTHATPLDRHLDEARRRLSRGGHNRNVASVISRYFGGVYFSWEQAIDLDSLLESIHALDDAKRDYFLAIALAVASDVVNTVGKHFAQPIKPRDTEGIPKRHLVKQTIRDRSIRVFDYFEICLDRFDKMPRSTCQHRVFRADYRDILSDPGIQFDAVYADPPYTRDHYSRYYHVLETMSLRDEPEISTTTIRTEGIGRLSRGIYRADRHQSPFCIKTQASDAFEELCAKVVLRKVPLILSYSPYKEDTGNRPRLLTIDELFAIVRRHFKKTRSKIVDNIVHNKFNMTERNVDVDYAAEILVVCTP